jgi:cytochrome P450
LKQHAVCADPPKHAAAKSLLLPAFTPDAIERYAVKTREICPRWDQIDFETHHPARP